MKKLIILSALTVLFSFNLALASERAVSNFESLDDALTAPHSLMVELEEENTWGDQPQATATAGSWFGKSLIGSFFGSLFEPFTHHLIPDAVSAVQNGVCALQRDGVISSCFAASTNVGTKVTTAAIADPLNTLIFTLHGAMGLGANTTAVHTLLHLAVAAKNAQTLVNLGDCVPGDSNLSEAVSIALYCAAGHSFLSSLPQISSFPASTTVNEPAAPEAQTIELIEAHNAATLPLSDTSGVVPSSYSLSDFLAAIDSALSFPMASAQVIVSSAPPNSIEPEYEYDHTPQYVRKGLSLSFCALGTYLVEHPCFRSGLLTTSIATVARAVIHPWCAAAMAPIKSINAMDAKEVATQMRKDQEFADYVQSGLVAMSYLGPIAVANKLKNSDNPAAKLLGEGLSQVFSPVLISTTLATPINKGIKAGAKTITSRIPGARQVEKVDELTNTIIEFDALNIEFDRTKDKMTESVQELFQQLNEGAVALLSRTGDMNDIQNENERTTLKNNLGKYTQLMRTLVSLPQEPKDLGDLEALEKRLEPIYKRHDKKTQKRLELITNEIWRGGRGEDRGKTVIFLVGDHGVGKTSFVRLYAKSLGLTLIVLEDMSKAFLSDTSVFSWGQLNPNFVLPEFIKRLTKLSATGERNPKNIVLFLDEIEKFLNGLSDQQRETAFIKIFFHQLLDPGTTLIRLPGLDIEYDFSNFIIFAAGNDIIRGKGLLSLSKGGRLLILPFSCVPKDKRRDIAKGFFNKAMEQRKLPKKDEYVQLVEQLAEQDPYCGVRSLELIINEELQPWVDRKERGKDDEPEIADWIESRPDTKYYEGPWKETKEDPAVPASSH